VRDPSEVPTLFPKQSAKSSSPLVSMGVPLVPGLFQLSHRVGFSRFHVGRVSIFRLKGRFAALMIRPSDKSQSRFAACCVICGALAAKQA